MRINSDTLLSLQYVLQIQIILPKVLCGLLFIDVKKKSTARSKVEKDGKPLKWLDPKHSLTLLNHQISHIFCHLFRRDVRTGDFFSPRKHKLPVARADLQGVVKHTQEIWSSATGCDDTLWLRQNMQQLGLWSCSTSKWRGARTHKAMHARGLLLLSDGKILYRQETFRHRLRQRMVF